MVRVEWRDRVVVVTIDRPERRNAVDLATLLALRAAQEQATSAEARVMVLTGVPPAFCAGADLTGVDSGEFLAALTAVLRGFTESAIVSIAAVHGPALGAGTQLALACDLRVATESSRFGVPAAKLGLAVDQFTVARVTQELGAPVARAMLLAAETFSGERLHACGAVHRLGDLDVALAWADEIAALAPLTIAAHKLALESLAGSSTAGHPDVNAARDAAWASADADEGRLAFLHKRAPRFTGR